MRRNEGSVLVIAIVITMILSILLIALTTRIIIQKRQVNYSYHRERAFALAESGIEVALACLNEKDLSDPYPTISGTIPDMGTFSVEITGSSTTVTITSTGYSRQGGTTRASRAVLVTAKCESSVFDYGIASQGNLKLEDPDTTVDGDIYCDGDIDNQGASVSGVGVATGSINGETFFEGGVQEGAEQITFPEIDMDYYKDNSDEFHSGDYSFGNRTLNGEIIYVEGDVTIENVTLEGPGMIVAEGSIKVSNGARCGTSEDNPVGLLSNSTNSTESDPAIKLEMAADVYGIIYAPRGYIKIETSSNIYGTIAGGAGIGIKVETGGGIYYTSYGGLGSLFPLPGTLRIVHWQEIS